MTNLTEVTLKETEPRARILIVDDEKFVRNFLLEILNPHHDCVPAESTEEALSLLKHDTFDLVITDIKMAGATGLELTALIFENSPGTAVIIISGQHSIDSAIDAFRVGAFDYLTKPFDPTQVYAAIQRALQHHRLLKEKERYDLHLEELVSARTAQIEHLAYHDSLTNLPNRALLMNRCEELLATSCRANHQTGALLRLSLDRFKQINDTLGHATGDNLLIHVSRRLKTCVTAPDTLAKFDGGEFALLLTNADLPAAIQRAAELAKIIDPVIDLNDGQEVFLTVSVGIVLFPTDGNNAASVMQNAGAALDLAKRQGGTYSIYVSDMNAHALKHLELQTGLRHAVDNRQFVTHYQPIINLTSGGLVGFEALVRWQHPEFGLIPPGDFIGLAEDTGLILAIADLVITDACSQTQRWNKQGLNQVRIAVNISARQFRDENFSLRLMHILHKTRLDPQMLELEITESAVMEDFDAAINVLRRLRQTGIRVAIDDFGTGYSSLSYLKHLPIDTLKLDRSFVSGATSDPRDAALVMGIINLAHSLDLQVIAEGIETESQRDFLRLLRCDEGQGYFFGKPAPAGEIDLTKLTPIRKPNMPATLRPHPQIKTQNRKII